MPPFVNFVALKQRFSIADALRRYGYLDRMTETVQGHLKGPCLIHQSRPASTAFKVTPSLRGFYCFRCGAKGNVLDLVAAVEGIDVHEAALLIQTWLDEDGDPPPDDANHADAGHADAPKGHEESEGAGEGYAAQPSAYEAHLFSGVPLYSSRLVHEATVDFDDLAETSSPAALFTFLRPYFEARDREELVVVLLNTATRVIGLVPISVGGLNASIVEPRFVFKLAILANAAAVVVAHNHPSGNPEPSRQDVAVTRTLVEAGDVLGIPVHDHLIVAARRYTSLAERGLMH